MANQGLTSSASGAFPPAPSFADFRFSTIGQEPVLLKRISAQSLDLYSPYPSSPAPGELEYPSVVGPPRPLPRPTLSQSSAYLNTLGNDGTGPDTCTASQCSEARGTRFAEPNPLPHAQGFVSSQHTSTTVPRNVMASGTASPAPAMSSSQNSISAPPLEMTRTSVIGTAPATRRQTPFPAATVHQMHPSYAGLRALQGRLMTSLSKLHPPDMTNALLRVQMANSHSVNAFTTAHRSQILAQQSLATAQEAVTAAQECLSAAEKARTHTNDALTTIRQLHSGKVDFDAEATTEWEWKVNFIQLQDDLRMLGEWLVEKENEDTTSRDGQRAQDKNTVEAVRSAMEVSGSDSIVKDRSLEVSRPASVIQNRSVDASRVTPHSDPSSYHNLNHKGSLELEADVVARVPSSEQSRPSRRLSPIITEPVPMEDDVEYAEHDRDMFREAQQSANFNDTLSLTPQHQETLSHLSGDDARMQTLREEARLRKLHQKDSEVATFQRLQREHVTSEVFESTENGSQPKLFMNPTADGNTDTSQQSQNCVMVEDAQRALQMHGDKEMAFAETSKYKRESHRILEESKQGQPDELEKEGEQLTADEERELFANQERRRQEVMAQKQRATAEIAAKINAERAREKEKAMVASLQSTTSSTPQTSLHDCPIDSDNFVAQKSMPSKLTKKSKSLSCGDRSGATRNGQTQLTIPSDSFLQPSPVAGSAALRLPSSKTQASIDAIAGNFSSGEKPSQDHTVVTFRTPTPTNGINGGEELHVYRHSNDPGNLYLVPRSQVMPALPEAQAANLRYLKNDNCVSRDTSLLDLKPDSQDLHQSSLHQKCPVKKESPIPAPLVESQTRSQIETGSEAHSSLSISPGKPFSSASLPSTRHPISNQHIPVDQCGVNGTGDSTTDTSAVPSSNTITPPNPDRDDVSSTRKASKPMSKSPDVSSTTPLVPLDSEGTQIAPMIHANGGWDLPVDGEVYSGEFIAKEPTPERPRQSCRVDDYHSPLRAPTPDPYTSRGYAARSVSRVSRSPLSPARRSPVLGKRRQREDVWEDEHASRRHWPRDGTHRTRSPPPHLRQSVQRRSPSPDRHTLQAQMQETYHPDMSCARSPPSRERWRSPPPNRPALQARIGVSNPNVRAIHGGRTYRPAYSSDISERSRSWTRDSYPARQGDQSVLGQRLGTEPELRGSYYNRSRGGTSNHRVSPRRGDRGGKRFLNLEQRLASPAKPWTLINRLESPQRD